MAVSLLVASSLAAAETRRESATIAEEHSVGHGS